MRWPWKSEYINEYVTNQLLNELALKMDGAEAGHLYTTIVAWVSASMSTRAWEFFVKLTARAGVKRSLAQILVVVANIQMRTLKTEVGKSSA